MKKTLQELVNVRSGYHFRAKAESDPDGNVALIQFKDLDEDFVLHTSDLTRVCVEKPEPYLVRQNDVLFVTRGTRLGAAVVQEALEDTIATGSLFVLRPRKEILAGFLAWAINSAPVQAQLRRAGQGSNLLMVRRNDLEEITLDVPPLEVQRAIAALDECARRERRLTIQLNEKRAALVEAVAARAIQSHLK
jgi:hypothetical protein